MICLKDNIFSSGMDFLIVANDTTIEENLKFFLLKDKKYNIKTISKFQQEPSAVVDINKIDKPFSLNQLMNEIDSILKKESNILRFKNFNIVNNTLNSCIFGNKEIDLIRFLYKNPNSTKEEILKNVWGYDSEMDTKVFENTITKIKQKTKDIGIENFILNNNNSYNLCH